MRCVLTALFLSFLAPALADAAPPATIGDAVDRHILPRFAVLKEAADALAAEAATDCDAGSPSLRAAYHAGFDAWVGVSHLRFGPTEVEHRAFALAFWPDPRGKTRRALAALISTADPVVEEPERFRSVSVAAKGFYALEQLLYAPQPDGRGPYLCRLIRAVTQEIAAVSSQIHADWAGRYAALMRSAGEAGSPYEARKDAVRELYRAVSTGLQFTSEVRLGRPLGRFDRPRPKRAEARLSGRSLRHVRLNLIALSELAGILAQDHLERAPVLAPVLADALADALEAASKVDDPVFAAVADPAGRFRVELLQQRVETIRHLVQGQLGPALGVAAGFNALDGD